MAMAVKLVRHQASQRILLLAGYEGGVTAAFKLPESCTGPGIESAELLYLSQPHSQPILSLDASPEGDTYFTSSADAMLAMHRISMPANISEEQEPLDHRQDSSGESPPDTDTTHDTPEEEDMSTQFVKRSINAARKEGPKPSGLSSILSSNQHSQAKGARPPQPVTVQPPYKAVNTKHAGQQSLRVRSDGRLIITGGWDTRIRIYSSKTLKEVAVLKWHKQGVYAVAFSEILTAEDLRDQEYVRKEQRETQMKLKHWVAAGAKDGKISLWEVY